MEQNIFLERNRSEFSNNVEGSINLELSTKTRLLPNDSISDNFSLYEQYNRERDECEKYRLILNINPVCSNVLFNARTEILLNEGADNCELLNGNTTFSKENVAKKAVNTTQNIDYMTAIRNTEYSHKNNGGFVYHCGFDIFNNHMLRKKEFIHVNKIKGNSDDDGTKYNTIFDYCRDGQGNIVEEDIIVKYTRAQKVKMHLYEYDTIMSMPTAFSENCIDKDGWWGFTNPNTIEIPNSDDKSVSINRMMANNKACEFIDLYPDRTLFSFVPKFNKNKRRPEKNWDYCLTYPYKSDYEFVDTICGGELQAIRANIKLGVNAASQSVLECSSYFKHNFKRGDYVTFFYYMPHYEKAKKSTAELKYWATENGEFLFDADNFDENNMLKSDVNESDYIKKIGSKTFSRYNIKVKIESVGDANGNYEDKIFTVKYGDIKDIYEYMTYFGCFYKKNSGNSDCTYYFRKFKKLKDFNGAELKSDVNKIAFGKNIYGDDVAQVLYTDDIDVRGLLDNNGKPVSEIYFTVVKRNAGRKEWYDDDDYKNDKVEFSHCFGKVTSGIDFCGIENEPFNYNIHYLHNIELPMFGSSLHHRNTMSAWGETILSGVPLTIEDDITIDFDEFYGDIVEYDTNKATETTIGNVYHRFNTEQRETWNKNYQHIKQDTIVSDDYDYANGTHNYFNVHTYFLNNVKNSIDRNGFGENMMYGNIFPEGYYYNPHMKINIREIDDTETTSPAQHINYVKPKVKTVKTYLLFKNDGTIKTFNTLYDANKEKQEGEEVLLQDYYYEITFTAPVNYGFYKGDYIALYNKNTSLLVWSEITQVSGSDITLKSDGADMDEFGTINIDMFDPTSGKREFYAYWSPNNTPTYAKLCSGTKKFTWRKIVKPSEMMRDDELYDTPFANGRFYLEKNINFFVKRQDPTGKYGLSFPMYKVMKQSVSNPMSRFVIPGNNPIDFSEIMFIMNNIGNSCY